MSELTLSNLNDNHRGTFAPTDQQQNNETVKPPLL